MTIKRSRISRSSSFGDSPDRLRNTRKSPPGILTVSSPVSEKAVVCTDDFLKTCYFCRKSICSKKDVFMFGYLWAFCKPECRNEQIRMDTELEKEEKEKKEREKVFEGKAVELVKVNNGIKLFGVQLEKPAAPQFQIV